MKKVLDTILGKNMKIAFITAVLEMALETSKMVTASVDAFVKKDIVLAIYAFCESHLYISTPDYMVFFSSD